MITEQVLIVCIIIMALSGFVIGFLVGVLYVSDKPVDGYKPIKQEHKNYRPEPVMPPQKIRPYEAPRSPFYKNYLKKGDDKP